VIYLIHDGDIIKNHLAVWPAIAHLHGHRCRRTTDPLDVVGIVIVTLVIVLLSL